jgi:hypothetical protein
LPGVAFIVRFGSTSTSIGGVDPPPLLLDEEPEAPDDDVLDPPAYASPPDPPDSGPASTEQPIISPTDTMAARAVVRVVVQARVMTSS